MRSSCESIMGNTRIAHVATERGLVGIVKYLLDAVGYDLKYKGGGKLHCAAAACAAFNGRTDIVQLLLDAGGQGCEDEQ